MVEVIFNYEDIIVQVQSNENDKMGDIIFKFLTKIKKIENNHNLYYLYNGTTINFELRFNE